MATFETHHIICLSSSFYFQMEITSIFSCIRYFCKILNNKYVFFISGISYLIIYFISRLLLAPYFIYVYQFYLIDSVIEYSNKQTFYGGLFVPIFIVCLSIMDFIRMISSDVEKIYILK
eukprot:7314_1